MVLILALIPLAAIGEETRTVLLPEANAYFTLTERTRLFLLGTLTHDLTQDRTDGELGAHLDVTLIPILRRRLREGDWEREKYLWIRLGYRLIGNLDDPGHSPFEHRGIVEVTTRFPLPWDLWLVNRIRADLRDIDGEFSARLRDRLGLEREVTLWNHTMAPYLQAEVFYDTRFGAWSRERYQTGVEVHLSAHWRVEPYYRREENHRPARTHENAVGLVVKYYH